MSEAYDDAFLKVPYFHAKVANQIIELKKELGKILNLNISVVFKQLRMKHLINKNIKNKQEIYDIPNIVYAFRCDCNKKYIGESSLRLESRIRSHVAQKEQSSIINHIDTCDAFKSRFHEYCSAEKIVKSCPNSLMSFLKKYFTVKRKCMDSHQRRWIEGFEIKIEQPLLNKKEDFVYNINL